ncbi:MAG: ABC transporter ATP-binding protein [Thermoleophilia bacterium]
MSEPILSVVDLHVEITSRRGVSQILRGVSVDLAPGAMTGLVGETGSGKSMTARAVMGLLPTGGRVTAGRVLLRGRDLLALDERAMRQVRGPEIGMVFQNPRTALYPMLSVESQMANVLDAHLELPKSALRERIRSQLALAGIPDPDRVARAYPHELSGGMAQRVVIATALLCEPTVLIADEPTTGLDATIQRQILELLAQLQRDLGLTVLMITHDLGIVAQYCQSVSVMNDGVVVEQGDKRAVLRSPADDYTRHLVAASRLEDIRTGRPR